MSNLVRRARRLPFAWWAAAIVLSMVVGIAVAQSVASAQEAAQRYGDQAVVTVAVRNLPPGAPVTAADVRTESRPRAFLPVGQPSADPEGRVVSVPTVEGEIFLEEKLAPGGLSPLAALLRPGERAVSVPNDEATPRVQVGDHVDAIGAVEAPQPIGGDTTLVLSGNGRVVAISEQSTTVAVRSDEAPRVAAGVSKGRVSLAVTPGL